jgi:hypothetical protein
MTRSNLVKFALAALVVATAAVPARADIIVFKVDGTNFKYTAVDTSGVLKVSFDPTHSFLTQINDNLVPQIQSEFAQLTLSPTFLTDDTAGISGHFIPNLNQTQFGVTSLTPDGAPNVVFDYTISFGQVSADGLTMTGTVALDPASATTYSPDGGVTVYDFRNFQNFVNFTLSIGTSDATGVLVYTTLKSGNGTFGGTGQFDFVAVPEPTSVVLLGIGGVITTVLGRRRKN